MFAIYPGKNIEKANVVSDLGGPLSCKVYWKEFPSHDHFPSELRNLVTNVCNGPDFDRDNS